MEVTLFSSIFRGWGFITAKVPHLIPECIKTTWFLPGPGGTDL